MSKRNSVAVLIAGLALAVAACGMTGSGNLITEERDVGEFDSIDVSAGIDLILTIDPDAEHSVTVTYDDNIIDEVDTRVRNGTLFIDYRTSLTLVGSFGSDRVVEVTAPALDGIEASGGSSVVASGRLDAYSVTASGGADTDLRDLEAEEVEVDASGGADVEIYARDSVTGEASGGADVEVFGDPDNVRVDTSGGADVRIR